MNTTVAGIFINNVGKFITSTVSWIPKFTHVIIDDPLLVLPFIVLVVGLVVGIIGRLLSLR